MQVRAYKTKKIVEGDNLFAILEESLPKDIPDHSVVAVSSKIIAICEGRLADPEKFTRDELAIKESEYYLPRESNPYDVMITIKDSTFIASAGIDHSNGNGKLVLWPQDVQKSANDIREFLVSQYPAKKLGIVVTDSKTSPLRWGVTGIALSFSGFSMLNSYVGKPDVFGRPLKVEKVNIADTLAAAAVGEMGEGNEQTPIAVISDILWVEFVDRNPTTEELERMKTNLTDDIFAPLLTAVDWKKGGE